MNCREIRALLAARHELTYAQERMAQSHLAGCQRCREQWQREERALSQLRTVPAWQAELPAARLQAIRMRLSGRHRPRLAQRWSALAVLLLAVVVVGLVQWRPLVDRIQATGSALAPMFGGIAWGRPQTLYLVSGQIDPKTMQQTGSHVTVIDLASAAERYRVEHVDEVSLSPDGKRLYVAGWLPGGSRDILRALDAQSGRELWSTPVTHRAGFPGQQNLLVSPDGRWLYLRSYDVSKGNGDAYTVPFWLQIIDTATGAVQQETIELPHIGACGAPTLASPAAGTYAYISCYWGKILAVNTQTHHLKPAQLQELSGHVFISEANRLVIVNSSTMTIVDPATHAILSTRPFPTAMPDPLLVTLSGDGRRLVVGWRIQGVPGTDTATEIRLIDVDSGTLVAAFRYEQPIGTFVLDRTGQILYAATGEFPHPATTILALHMPQGEVQSAWRREGEQMSQMFLGP